MKAYKTYFFDFDGTLFNTIESLKPVYRAGFGAVGISVNEEECERFIHVSLEAAAKEKHMKMEDVPAFVKAINKAINSEESMSLIKIYPETEQTLMNLKKTGARLAIVSGNAESHMRPVLERFGLSDFFETVTGNESFKRNKPFPDPLLVGLERMGLKIDENSVYVGDSLQDVKCGEEAKLDAILIDRENEHPDFKKTKIASLMDLLS